MDSNDYHDRSIPWFVPVGVFLFLLAVILFSFNPRLLRNITSFKAGGIEAHFGEGSSATVQSGQIASLDLVRAVTIHGWAEFQYPTVDSSDDRRITYSDAALEEFRMKKGRQFFNEQITPIFKGLLCLAKYKKPISFKYSEILKKIAYELANEIEKGQLNPNQDHNINEINSANEDLKELSGDLKDFRQYLEKACVDTFEIGKLVDATEILQELDKSKGSMSDVWDSYVIQATSDLLLIASGRRENVDFLVSTSTEISNQGRKCRYDCEFEAGDLSLAYALIAAKIQSERAWPFDDIMSEFDRALGEIDRILQLRCLSVDTESRFRMNRLADLSMGLQFFYQRALIGQKFTPAQLKKWGDWLKEVRDVLNLVADVGSKWPTDLNDDERRSWLRSARRIEKVPYILQDAAIGSALGVVLIASQTDQPSSVDCLAARSLLNYANENLTPYFASTYFEAEDQYSYKGFLEQVKTHINGSCNT